jgi:hypothetical protein
LQQTSNQVVNATTEKVKMEQELNQLELKNKESETSLAIVEMLKHCRGTWRTSRCPGIFCQKIYWKGDSSGLC